ncbi:hypothetical protein B0H21DRAFT_895108 [Amylocystis lapponica]|nr:hypothetical protein B0H21DRAFT_895108 [Amylocystis lapponica]
MDGDMESYWREVPLRVFMDKFIGGDESEMYAGFCRVTQSALNGGRGDLVARDTGDWPDNTGSSLRPDMGIYPTNTDAVKAYRLTDEELAKSRNKMILGGQRYMMARVSWAWLCVPIQFKADTLKAPFAIETGDSFLRDTELAKETRGQLVEHTAQVLLRQHRLFCYTISVYGCYARLLRWDRAGAVVSESFNYMDEQDELLTFIYKLGRMTRAQLGYDPSATLLAEADVQAYRDWKAPTPYLQACHADAFDVAWPIYRIEIRAEDFLQDSRDPPARGTKASVLIAQPRWTSSSVTGRATRGYVALDEVTNRVVFLKDTWRAQSRRARQEREVYERLYANQVRNIPTEIVGPDNERLSGRIHSRLVMEEICRSLEEYQKSYEMLWAVRGALTAHQDAWEKARILHCDISVGNILILELDPDDAQHAETMYFPDPRNFSDDPDIQHVRGLLIDWDLCKFEEDLGKGATNAGRPGTWQFMSARSLIDPTKPYAVADDAEAFVHVVQWLSLKYHKTRDLIPSQLASHVWTAYDAYGIDNAGYHVGGVSKLSDIRGVSPHTPIFYRPKGSGTHLPFVRFLNSLSIMCREDYLFHRWLGGQIDEEPEESDPPVPEGTDTLGTHRGIIEHFDNILRLGDKEWWPQDKLDSQYSSLMKISTLLHTSSVRLGKKWGSEESET